MSEEKKPQRLPQVGDVAFRWGEEGIVKEVGPDDLKTTFQNGDVLVYLANPTGGIVIEWNGLGKHHCQRYAFEQIDIFGIKFLGMPKPEEA